MAETRQFLRLDKFLYFIRFAKSRSKATALVVGGNARIDRRAIVSTHVEVRVGQVVTLVVAGKVRAIEILCIPARRGPVAEAQACYRERIEEQPIDVGRS